MPIIVAVAGNPIIVHYPDFNAQNMCAQSRYEVYDKLVKSGNLLQINEIDAGEGFWHTLCDIFCEVEWRQL